MKINFDMDGVLCGIYDVEGWLTYIHNEDTTPYEIAKPLMNMSLLARYLNRLQSRGYEINIISWTAKNGTREYNERVAKAKMKWLKTHLASVQFDNIHIIDYGTPKHTIENGILFDDEKPNRDKWGNGAYEPSAIFEILRSFYAERA